MNVVVNYNEIVTNQSSSIRSKLEYKNNSLQFLSHLLDDISKKDTFYYKGNKLKTPYLIDIVHNLILKYYFKRENRFNLSSTILKEKYGHLYNFYIDYLVDKKILILLLNYKKGTRSRIYALNEVVLRGKITRYRNSDKVLLKKYKNKISQVEEESIEGNSIDSDVKVKLVNDLFYVDIELDRSIFYLDSLKNEDNDIYNRNRYSVECIGDKHIFYHFDSYGRLHTNFTILKSFLRKNCLLIDGEETCEIDVKNSQPLFLTKLIQDSGTNWVKKDEFELFKYLTTEGKYYQYIQDSLDIKNKSDAKEMTYKVLFGRNGNSSSDKKFSKLFPTIHNFIKLYKKENDDYKVIAYELQRAESNLIFNKIVKQIHISYPEIKLVTVHDSIIVAKKYREEVSSIFYSKLYEEFGLI